jgi:hypothetical protein
VYLLDSDPFVCSFRRARHMVLTAGISLRGCSAFSLCRLAKRSRVIGYFPAQGPLLPAESSTVRVNREGFSRSCVQAGIVHVFSGSSKALSGCHVSADLTNDTFSFSVTALLTMSILVQGTIRRYAMVSLAVVM